ncbi:MAG: ATP-binding protein [Bacteroidota bacterium]
MTSTELRRLADFGEGPSLEFKLRVPKPNKLAREVIAFANTDGGKLLVGVDDDGTVKGVKDVEEERFAIEDALSRLVAPRVPYRMEQIPINRKREALVLHIPASPHKPHFLQDGTANGRGTAFVRVDDQALEASREMVRIMRAQASERPVQFEYGAKEQALMEYLDRYERITVKQLARLVNVSVKRASQTLVLLTKARLLQIHPSDGEDFFTLAFDG